MNISELRSYCLSKKGTRDDLPFGEDVLVIKVASKMFALISADGESHRVNLKCDPSLALELRRKYVSVEPGYHMNKQHWNTVHVDGDVLDKEIFEMIDHSYRLVLKGLKKSEREWVES